MNVWVIYIFERFFYRIIDFLRRWYVTSTYRYYVFVLNTLRDMDNVLVWRITAKNIFEPLFGDYSLVGHVIGFGFRSARLIGASIVYAVVLAVALSLYIVWLAIPLLLVYKIII